MYSRDHRPDCKQLVIALVVNSEGSPIGYEVFAGNRSDMTTLETMLLVIERKYGKARRVWVFDRGTVSEENLRALRRRGGQYLVGTPSKLKEFEQKMEELKGKALKLKEDAKKEFDGEMKNFQKKQAAAERKLEELKSESTKTWERK